MATKPKPKPTSRTPKTKGNNRYSNFNAKANVANKMMDKVFKDGKPREGTSVIERIAYKSKAWDKLSEATDELKAERKAKEAGKTMARAQSFKKAYKAKPR